MASKTVLGACPQDCPDTCSMLVSVEDGKVTGVRGNPDHPFTRGRLCVKVNNYEEKIYSPDRMLHPLRRVGAKGSAEFERISWDEALDEIQKRWTDIIAEHGTSAIMPYSYLGTQGNSQGLNVGDAFFNKMGASVSERTFCDSGSCTAYAITIGDTAGVDPEALALSKYIVLWATNPLSTNSHLWPFILQARKNGAKIVVIDPYKTTTAKQADWHIPILPGTDGALALGLMNVIIEEGLTDDDYIENYTLGFDELKEHVKDFDPDTVAGLTGLNADDVRKLAREFAAAEPAVIRVGVAIERHAGGGQTVRSLACLPALTGAWRKPGGGILQLPIWVFPMRWDAMSRADFLPENPRVLNLWKLGEILNGDVPSGPPIKSLMVYNANPAVTTAEQEKVIQGLRREDLFTVVSEHFITDTARYADIILPATTQMEQEEIMFSWGHFYLSFNNKAIEPLGECIPNTELFRRLAARMGFDDPHFKMTDEELMRNTIDWDSPVMEGYSYEHVKEQGYVRLNLPETAEYAPHAEGNFHTPSGKCEFVSSAAAGGNFVIPLFRQGYTEQQMGDEITPMPIYIPPNESMATNPTLGASYPLSMVSPKSHAYLSSTFGNLAVQQEHNGRQSVVMHPADAAVRGITDGSMVSIKNDRGSFVAHAKVTEDVRAGVVFSPVGHWRHGSEANATVQAILPSTLADLGGAPTFSDTLVEVSLVNMVSKDVAAE